MREQQRIRDRIIKHGRWEECPNIPGFRVMILWPDPIFFMNNWFQKIDWIDKNSSTSCNAKLCREFMKTAINDYEGLTVAKLRILCPDIIINGEDSQKIAFSLEILEIVLSFSPKIVKWLSQMVLAQWAIPTLDQIFSCYREKQERVYGYDG